MNHINQITRILNALYDIDYLKVCCTTVEDNMLIIDFTYDNERAICSLYNKVPGGYVVTNPGVGQLSFTLSQFVSEAVLPAQTQHGFIFQ